MKKLIGFIVLFLSLAALASDKGNGGDTCENRIKVIRNDIESWILRGGAESLKLPSGLSYQEYESAMLSELKAGHSVICTDDKVYVGRAEKTCKNYEGNDGVSRIKCNLRRFSVLGEEDQYRLIHHEYAGLAGFEVNTGEESKYFISNQLTAYLENEVVKKLAIKEPSNSEDLKIDLVRIQAGTFQMGSPRTEEGRRDNEDLRVVTIKDDFYMMTTEVTQDLFVKVTGYNPSVIKQKEFCPETFEVRYVEESDTRVALCPNLPVDSIYSQEANVFIELLRLKTGENYRLPNEAEWEFAARAGSQAAYSFGSNSYKLAEYAIFNKNSDDIPKAVGPFRDYANKPNRNGLYDMHGNVWELTIRYSESTDSNDIKYIYRGGGAYYPAKEQRSASRFGSPVYRKDIGFRLVKNIN